MKKQDLLKFFDDLFDKLFGFCYARTNDSYEAEELSLYINHHHREQTNSTRGGVYDIEQ